MPPAPQPLTAAQAAAVRQQLAAAKAAPQLPAGIADPAANEAIGGLSLPDAAPPLPNVPGVNWAGLPAPMAPAAAPAPAPVAAFARPDGKPLLLAFQPNSAVLGASAAKSLRLLASARGGARIRVGGFGEQRSAPDPAALALALRRARRIADALTAAGVPPPAISLTAAASGTGGFAQLVY